MRKIKWGNVVKAVIFIGCMAVVLHDVYMLTIGSMISGNLYGWSLLGLTTFILCFSIACSIFDDFETQLKKMSYATNIRHQNK